MTTRRKRSKPVAQATSPAPTPAAPPRKGPPPPTKPPYPFLARLVPPDLARKGYTYRHLGAVDFYHARGEVRFQGLKEMIMHTWPGDFIHSCVDIPDGQPDIILTPKWNAWLERHLRGFVNEEYAIRQGSKVVRFVGLTGCASASKTHSTALYAIAWWQVEPEESIVVLTSTTKDMIRSRVWSVVQHYASTAIDSQTGEPIELGHLVPSQMKLLPLGSKDSKHTISAYAVAHGETLKAIDNLKGLHAKRMLVVIDEANGTPEAIFNVLPNYLKGCMDLTIIVIGNPVSRLDPHGRALKPSDGWSLAMDEKVIEWRTEGVKEWELPPGLALRFDGRDSPNVVRRRTCYPYLYHYEDWLKAEKSREEHGGTFSYWSFSRGMWPADGMSNVIFTEQLFLRCEAIGTQFTFESERVTLAFLDVAFGGDGCILQFAELGNVAGRQVLQLTDWVDVPIDPSIASHDIDYQIARWVMQTCIVRKVKPDCFGLDATGTGRGVGAILAAEWSPKIHYTTWGQAPTDRPSAQNDGRPGKEVYATFVTELWFAVRELLEAGQVKGFSRESIGEFCSRQYEMSGRKYKAETKDDMRQRLRYSPDHADAVVGVVEVARRLGLDIDGKVTQTAQKEWDRSARAISKLYDMDGSGTTPSDNEGGWAEQEVHDDVAVTVEVENVWD